MMSCTDRVVDKLRIAMIGDGISQDTAAGAADQLHQQLSRNNRVSELFVYSLHDVRGRLHVCVGQRIPNGGVEVYRLAVPGLLELAAREAAEEAAIDWNLHGEGTEV